MLNMIELLDQTRNKWRLAQTEGERLASKVASVERENRNLHEEIEAVQERFRKSEEKVASLLTTQQSMKAEIVEYKKRFESVRNILKVRSCKTVHLPFCPIHHPSRTMRETSSKCRG